MLVIAGLAGSVALNMEQQPSLDVHVALLQRRHIENGMFQIG